jgi:hydroxyacylglutathione hydrolase
MQLIPIPAFSDNYVWMLHDGERALVVDPGEAAGVRELLAHQGLRLDTILLTHHHADHTGGVAELREATGARVIGPAFETLPEPVARVSGGDLVDALGLRFQVLGVPGHTAGHIAYFCAALDGRPLLFCGDTLFSGGCGRLFEGTPAQMHASLSQLAALPGDTRVCCTHEYTLSNLKFALVVEPGNAALDTYHRQCLATRARGEPTLPSSIDIERRINPFLRTGEPAVLQAAQSHAPGSGADPVSVFATLREWKNVFR